MLPTSQAYLFNAPSGVPGDVTRPNETSIEPAMLGTPTAGAFGIPVKYDTNGNIIPIAANDTASVFAGVLIREAPAISGSNSDSLTGQTPNSVQPQGFAVRGYVSVVCTIGTPVRGGIVYIRVVAASGKFVGDFEATADGSNNVALSSTQASWASNGKDSANNAELRIAR